MDLFFILSDVDKNSSIYCFLYWSVVPSKCVSFLASISQGSVSPLCQAINCDEHRKVSKPHIGKIEPAVIDQRQSHVAHDSVNTCSP